MGKALILLVGILFSVGGALIIWWRWDDFVTVFWGLGGPLLVAAGILALAIAISELSSAKKD